MAVIKRYNELLNLDEIDVLIDEVDKSRHIIVSDFPESMPQGRSSFAIEVSPFMKSGVELQMDFIDSEGASIYSEPVADYLEGTARRVSVEVYSDTAPGIATLIIVGELEAVPEDNTIFSDSDPVPDEYAGHYNIRLTKQVLINPTSPNTQPIKFFTQPKITVSEISIGTMQRSEVTSSISSSKFDIEGFPTDADLVFKPYGNLDEEIGGSVLQEATDDTVPAPSRQRNVKAYTETKKVKFRKGLRKNSVGKRSGFVAKANSPAKFPYLLKPGTFNGNEAFRFSTKHIGGTVKFFDHNLGNLFEDSDYYPADALADAGLNSETPTYDTSKVPGRTDFAKTPYTASIVDLINDQTAVVDAPFTNKNLNNENIVLPIYAKGEITFESLPTASYAAANLVSYADVRLSNMRTFSGDVFKVKVYVKSEGGFDDYKLLAEVPLEGKELLLDSGSVGQGERSGYVIKQSDISTYWDVYGGIDGLQEMSAADSDASASYDNSTLLDSIELSGSISQNNHNVRLQLKDNYEFDLDPKLDYTLSANIVGRKEYGKGALAIYVSGSSMKQKKFLYNDPTTSEDIQESSAYGKRLGVLELKAEDDIKKDFGLLTHNFTPDLSGSGVLQFRAISGKWNISDISIQPSDDTGFSPAFFQFKQELPASLSHKRPDKFEFLVEFYDVNNNISDTTVYASGIDFQGTNMTITGNDNVLESSLFIGGDTIGGGMHLGGVTSTLPETGGSGADGSGFMRSVGYQGFTSASAQSGSYGFMIWSGSVLPDSGDTYSGVGLELVGVSGSFKFRTNPSVFDVRADSFFVGRQDIQFVSGAAGNVEISSSEFHLTPQGNVTASAILLGNKAGNNYLQFVDDTLTVAGDLTVNNLFLPATINGAPSTRLNASSSLDALGHAKFVSASIGGWNVTPDYIFKPISGAAAHKDITRVYLSATQDNIKNIAEGLQVYRKDEDVEDGGVKVVRIGGLSDTTNLHANDEYGIQVIKQNSAGSYSNLMYIGPSTQEIAGWTIDSDKLTGGDMIIEKSGTIRSSNYVKDQAGSGFILTAAEGGYLEVENAKIRGTMATTTFEKESVNAVGGQLYVANSTTLTASAFPTTAYPGGHGNGVYQANETTMSVVNVSGFSVGEVLTLKKVHSTGFSTEYVRVNSSSVANPGSDTDLSGQLYVTRGYSGSRPTGQDSSSLGDVASSPTFYSGSQVIVSTGKIGTGFIRINANPNDSATPYIDIVERTGSAIYDTELKARLGDLSGVAGTRNVPAGFTGFGLMSEVAFLSGSQIKLEAPTFLLGDLNSNFVSGSNGNLQLSSSNFHLKESGDLTLSGFSITANAISSSNDNIILKNTGEVTFGSTGVDDGIAYNAAVAGQITSSLIHHYSFNFTSSRDFEDGDRYYDLVTTSTGSLFFDTDVATNMVGSGSNAKIGQSFYFSGDSAWFVQNPYGATDMNRYTVSLWFKADDISSATQQVIWSQAQSDNGIIFYLKSSTLYGGIYDADGGNQDQVVITSTDIASNTWHHIALTYYGDGSSSSTTILYLDGVEVDSANETWADLQTITSFGTSDMMIGAVRGTTRTISGTSSATSRSDTSDPLILGFTGYIDDVRCYSSTLTAAQVAFLHSEAGAVKKPGFKFDPITEEIQLNSKNFFLGNQSSQFVSGSNGLLEISSSNFHISSEGQITASTMNLKGKSVVEDVAIADYFAYRNIDVTTSNYDDYLVETDFTNNSGTKKGWILYLDGSQGGEMGMMVTLNNLGSISGAKPDIYPIIGIVPPSQNVAGTAPPSSEMGAGHRIIIECKGGAGDDIFFCRNNGAASNTDGVSILSGGYYFACDEDDPYFFGFSKTRQVDSGDTYRDCLLIDVGTRVEFARSNDDFKIQSISSLANIGLSVPGSTATFNLEKDYLAGTPAIAPAPFVFAGGWNSNKKGTIFISANPEVVHDVSEMVTNDGATLGAAGGSGPWASASIAFQRRNANQYHVGPVQLTTVYGSSQQEYLGIGGMDGEPLDHHYSGFFRESRWALKGTGVINPHQEDFDFSIAAVTSPSKGPKDSSGVIVVDAAHGQVGIGGPPGGSTYNGAFKMTADYANYYVGTFHNDGNNENRHGIRIQTGTDNGTGDTVLVNFLDGDGNSYGNISHSGGVITYGAFTGVHYAYVLKSESNLTDIHKSPSGSESGSVYPFGTVVSMISSSVDSRHPKQPLHYVVSSSVHQDKRAFGVYNMAKFWGVSGSEFDNGAVDEMWKDHRWMHTIQALGDGYILTSNQNGNIQIGDYLTTASGSGGYACKQSDDLLHNYTVAKATENVDWSNESTTTKLIACTYHCG